MTKLKRGFLDTKRLISVALNYNTREGWLVDYVQAIGEGLQGFNSQEVEFENEVKDYVLYNGQQLNLKTYVDDQVDIVDRRSIIQDNAFASYAFYGYIDAQGNYVYEPDPNPTTFYGYEIGISADYTWYKENDPLDNNPPLFGYITYVSGDVLRDSLGNPILDLNDEFIYTLEDALNSIDYTWIKEAQEGDRLTILIHDDIFNGLTEEEIETLKGKLARYIIAPYSSAFGIEGYS